VRGVDIYPSNEHSADQLEPLNRVFNLRCPGDVVAVQQVILLKVKMSDRGVDEGRRRD